MDGNRGLMMQVVAFAAVLMFCGVRPVEGQPSSRVVVFVEGGGATSGQFGPAYGGGVLISTSRGTHVQIRALTVSWDRQFANDSIQGPVTTHITNRLRSGKTLVTVGFGGDRPHDSLVRVLFGGGAGVVLYRRHDTVRSISDAWHPLGQDRTTETRFNNRMLAFYGEFGLIADVHERLQFRGGVLLSSTLGEKDSRQFDGPATWAVTVGVGYRF